MRSVRFHYYKLDHPVKSSNGLQTRQKQAHLIFFFFFFKFRTVEIFARLSLVYNFAKAYALPTHPDLSLSFAAFFQYYYSVSPTQSRKQTHKIIKSQQRKRDNLLQLSLVFSFSFYFSFLVTFFLYYCIFSNCCLYF